MHGRVHREGESYRSLRKSSSQHMQSVPSLGTNNNTVASVGDHNCSLPSSVITNATSDSFFKDGRKIKVGDCALFKPPQDSPPFIGLIRWLTSSKNNNLQLGVNWLYRPAELHLGKGIVVEGAPNEIFYSFHKDKIPAASLLHPCKVAFLPRGVDLPAGTSSFVCRRVYDIANKCLWWLTDQDYINERQEEVDQLLYKTRTEMHVKLQPGGRSPKQVNGPTSTSQLKPASDCGQNSGSTLHSQVKGKKRERGDHSADPVKRERCTRTDDGDSLQCKAETSLKLEIARIAEKGVVDLEGVEKLVQLMQQDRIERKMDLVSRSMLAGVMASTDQTDCLNRFMQLQGLPVLDEWLQDAHKVKIGDGNSVKNSDKSVEDFLLVLLRALDKLPVNLHALQKCNIGRSVNHLRSHKNVEIQRKARSLVDIWKKRVEAEMISIDAKSGSTQAGSVWPSKSRLPEASHGGSRAPSSSDVAIKSSITQNSASKATSVMSSHGENNVKSATSSPGPIKQASSPSSVKESLPKNSVGGTPDVPQVREDRSSSSNQSHNYSLSSSGKEDGMTTTTASVSVNKMSNTSTRNRKISGFSGISVIGNQKEINSSRNSSAHKSTALEKLSQSALSSEGPSTEGSSHKLIVKIPSRVRSPPQGVGGASLEDSTYANSRVSSPVLSDKHEQSERTSEDKSDTYRCNTASDINDDSWKNNGLKDVMTRSSEGAGSPAAITDEEHGMSIEESRKLIEGPPMKQLKSMKLQASSFSPMNALVESCAKYSEANTSLSLEDDVGMNLLASVAAGEMSRSNLVSPADSTEKSTPAVEEVCNDDEAKSKSSPEDYVAGVQHSLCNNAEIDGKKDITVGEGNKTFDSSRTDMRSNADHKLEACEKSKEKTGTTSLTLPVSEEKVKDAESNEEMLEEKVTVTSSNFCNDGISISKSGVVDMVIEEKHRADPSSTDKGKPDVEVAVSNQSCEGDNQNDAKERLKIGSNSQQKLASDAVKSESVEQADAVAEAGDEVKVREPDEKDGKICVSKSVRLNFDTEIDKKSSGESRSIAGLCSTANDLKSQHKEANFENKVVSEHISVRDRVPDSASFQPDEAEESVSAVAEASSSAAGASDVDTKMEFDLNEGLSADEGKYEEPLNVMSSDTALKMINSFSVNSLLSSHSASITVAAAAKGPFVPPEDLLRSKGELGWKGSAATSAFRPAEPRKAIETPLGLTSISCPDSSTSKRGRVPLDIDLNVPDERVLEEMASRDSALAVDSTAYSMPVRGFGGLDLDLNRVDEANDNGNCSTTANRKGELSIMHIKPLADVTTGRDFDLNDGPSVDDASVEQFPINQQIKAGIPSHLPPAGLRMNNPGLGNFSSWFSPGNAYSTVGMPTMLPDRGDPHSYPVFPPNAPQRTFGPSGVTQFTPDIYRGSVLSSSPAMPFPSSPFQFPVFPFGTTYPIPSATFPVGATSYADASSGPRLFAPPVHSQLLGPVGTVTSQFQRPYLVGLPDSSNNGVLENSRKWGRQGLDLNAGPGSMETDAREEMLHLSSGQHFVASSQALAEEQARMFSVSGGILKRKEPEGGWENESFRYSKQSSWQ